MFWVAGILPQNSIVIEFGSYRGASSLVLAAAVARRGGMVYCVDTWQNDTMPEGRMDTMPDFHRNTKPFADSIRVLRQKTTEMQLHQLPRPADFVFIDADHSYEAVRADVQTVLPLLSRDAGLMFHDVNAYSGVSRVVGDLLSSGKWQLFQVVKSLAWLRPNRGSANQWAEDD